jgi:hypothetical protein
MWFKRRRADLYARWAQHWRLAPGSTSVASVLSRLTSGTQGVHEAYLSSERVDATKPDRQILHVVVEARRSRIVTRDLMRGLREAFTRDQRPTIRVHDARDPGLAIVRQHAERLHPRPSRTLPWWILLLGG